MKNITCKFDDLEDAFGAGIAVALIILLVLIGIASPFLGAWIYQLVWNYGIVWLVARLGGSVPVISYWVGMGIYLVVYFIRHIFTIKVDCDK